MTIPTRALLIFSLFAVTASADDWPFFRGPTHNGISAESGWKTTWPSSGPQQLWTKEVGIGCSSMVTAGNKVLTMGNRDDRDTVWCLDTDSGKEIWTHEYTCEFDKRMFEGGTASTPTLHDGRVYTLSYDGQFFCLDLETGKVLWKKHLVEDFGGRLARWKYSCSPLVIGDKVIVDTGSDGNSTLALDRKTGKKIWGVGDDNAAYSSAIPFRQASGEGILMFKAKHMVAHDLASGRELWRIPWETSYDVNASSPIALKNHVVISSGYKQGRAVLMELTKGKPKEIWRNDELKTKMSSCVVKNGRVFGISEKKARLMCLDLKTGKEVWESRDFSQYGTLMIAGEHILALTEQGELVVVEANPNEFRELARAEVLNKRCWVSPVLSNGRVFCKNNDGKMVCLDVR